MLDALTTLAFLQLRLGSNDITIRKLRKLAGIVKSSETLKAAMVDEADANDADANDADAGKKNIKLRSKQDKPELPKVKPQVEFHPLETLSKGDDCPECDRGKVYKYDPGTLLRITGQSPFVPTQHVMERLRCNTCGAFFTAPLPEEVLTDGDPNQKYGYSARTLMGMKNSILAHLIFVNKACKIQYPVKRR